MMMIIRARMIMTVSTSSRRSLSSSSEGLKPMALMMSPRSSPERNSCFLMSNRSKHTWGKADLEVYDNDDDDDDSDDDDENDVSEKFNDNDHANLGDYNDANDDNDNNDTDDNCDDEANDAVLPI